MSIYNIDINGNDNSQKRATTVTFNKEISPNMNSGTNKMINPIILPTV